MSVPFQLKESATIIWTDNGIPHELCGEVTEVSEGALHIRVPDDIALPVSGQRCVLLSSNLTDDKRTARVETVHDGGVSLTLGRSHSSRRYYPRVDTPASFVYRLITLGESARGLSKRQQAVMKGWTRPAALQMNLSIDGLAFMSVVSVPSGSRIQLKLMLPGSSSKDISLVGEVVRSNLETLEDGEEYHHVAVHVPQLPPKTHEALVAYTLYFQDEFIGTLEQRPKS